MHNPHFKPAASLACTLPCKTAGEPTPGPRLRRAPPQLFRRGVCALCSSVLLSCAVSYCVSATPVCGQTVARQQPTPTPTPTPQPAASSSDDRPAHVSRTTHPSGAPTATAQAEVALLLRALRRAAVDDCIRRPPSERAGPPPRWGPSKRPSAEAPRVRTALVVFFLTYMHAYCIHTYCIHIYIHGTYYAASLCVPLLTSWPLPRPPFPVSDRRACRYGVFLSVCLSIYL